MEESVYNMIFKHMISGLCGELSVVFVSMAGMNTTALINEKPPLGFRVQTILTVAQNFDGIEDQKWQRRRQDFKNQFIGPGRGVRVSFPSDYDGLDSDNFPSNLDVIPGVFERTGENTATFTDSSGQMTDIGIDFGNRNININGNSGVANDVGLSGNNARGVVNLDNGRQVGIEVFGVNGKEPAIGDRFEGNLTDGITPDR
ncbi:MAG TPA: hypothetical protein DCF68_00480 [Cyanothece sp. UBA12306]|nr:hypothetical protein [Cyanothece sp. UBA12306]